MKNLVRFICLVLALSMLVFSFAACSDEEPSDGDPNSDGTTSDGGNNSNDNLGDIPDNLDGDNVTDIEDLLGDLK